MSKSQISNGEGFLIRLLQEIQELGDSEILNKNYNLFVNSNLLEENKKREYNGRKKDIKTNFIKYIKLWRSLYEFNIHYENLLRICEKKDNQNSIEIVKRLQMLKKMIDNYTTLNSDSIYNKIKELLNKHVSKFNRQKKKLNEMRNGVPAIKKANNKKRIEGLIANMDEKIQQFSIKNEESLQIVKASINKLYANRAYGSANTKLTKRANGPANTGSNNNNANESANTGSNNNNANGSANTGLTKRANGPANTGLNNNRANGSVSAGLNN